MDQPQEIIESSSEKTRKVLLELINKVAEFVEYQRKTDETIANLRHQNKLLRQKLFGSSSEKFIEDTIPKQFELDVCDSFALCATKIDINEAEIESQNSLTQTPSRAKKKPLPRQLQRKFVEHDLSEQDKQCQCGSTMEYIGDDVTENLDYQPPKLTVIQHRCKKYGCATCNKASKNDPLIKAQIRAAKKPAQIIPKGIATPSLLAQIAIAKFNDHLPLYRQSQIFNRYGIALSRQTMCEWMLKVSDAVIPLINLIQDKIIEYDVAFADETTLQVLNEPNRKAKTKSYMCCFVGGPPDQRALICQYHTGRQGDIAVQFLEGFRGGLHCDGYTGYNKLTQSDSVVGINCWAHVRKKFVDALPKGKEKGISGYVVRTIRALYQLEESLKAANATPDQIKQSRVKAAKPILDQLALYLAEKKKAVPPKSVIGKAIRYTLQRWPMLITYLQDGRYQIDNNLAERTIKPFVMGRKAWLFANSQEGAHASVRLFNLIETAKANGLNPAQYLQHIFETIPL